MLMTYAYKAIPIQTPESQLERPKTGQPSAEQQDKKIAPLESAARNFHPLFEKIKAAIERTDETTVDRLAKIA